MSVYLVQWAVSLLTYPFFQCLNLCAFLGCYAASMHAGILCTSCKMIPQLWGLRGGQAILSFHTHTQTHTHTDITTADRDAFHARAQRRIEAGSKTTSDANLVDQSTRKYKKHIRTRSYIRPICTVPKQGLTIRNIFYGATLC